jgi:hypothetical protein
MPFHHVVTAKCGVELKGSGVVTDDDLKGSYDRIFANDEDISHYAYLLIDLSGCKEKEVNLTTAQLRLAAETHIKALRLNPTMRIAFLATSDFPFGLCRYMQALTCQSPENEQNCRVSRDRAELLAWAKRESD